ncbi:hypothetical protein [Acidovorax sp. FHTAMBA]|uniref:hypothetical protein n=1 Tax=Acidovorax sp. FHTAMBA TaxID=3140252 RepID=UPI003182C979
MSIRFNASIAACAAIAFGSLPGYLASAQNNASPEEEARRPPFIVAPVIEGQHLCDEAALDLKVLDVYAAENQCRRMKISGAAALNRLLDALEPGGPKGQVQIGFTATLPLLGLYHGTRAGWRINEAQLDNFLRLIQQVKRPVVLYLAADHFDSFGPLARELQRDPRNLMQLRDGKPLDLSYFGYHVIPYTLQTDARIPVNRYRYAALNHVARKLRELPADVQARIIAITFLGELHHMFPDFENGMGAFTDIRTTDYSPASVDGFRSWLRRKFGTIGQLNAETGQQYASFSKINAPAKDIRKESVTHIGEHFDAYAGGILPFAGWLWDPRHLVERLDLYVNGKMVGPMERDLNRLDVYRAVDSVTSPNVGFRFNYDFSYLPPGRHHAQVIATSKNRQYLVGETTFSVVVQDQVPRKVNSVQMPEFLPSATKHLPELKAWMDLPGKQIDVYFNPVARLWNEYREWQVQQLMREFHSRAVKAGLPAAKLFSHQIMPRVNSSWNSQLLAADSTLTGAMPWNQGINLYGGATNSPWIRNYLATERISTYGVPEFHPQQWKIPAAHADALQSHYRQGARFVSPYYFSLIPGRFKGKENDVNRLEISPDNHQDGSSQLYRAVVDFAKR